MPFIFPKRVLQTGDVLAKADMNADWQPIGELASGGLDSHNLAGVLASQVSVADSTFHKAYYIEQGVNPGFGDNTGYTNPTLAGPPANAWVVPITSNWSQVGSMELTNIVTGISNLWIVGWCAYVYYGFIGTNGTVGTHAALTAGNFIDAGLQLALRVDGQILPETVTGHTDDRYRPVEPLKPQVQRSSANAVGMKHMPGPGLVKSHIIRGHGPQAGALRLVASAPVGPGNHTVELVARIVQKENPLASLIIADTAVGIHNRKLFVLDCPVYPNTAPSRSEVEIPAFDDATVVSTANMTTNRMTVLTTALNGLDAGHLQRGSFTNRHLPKVPPDHSYVGLTPASPVEYDCKYPGYGVDTLAAARTGNNVGWSYVSDPGGARLLRTDYDLVRAAGAIDATDDCLIVVMADVQLHSIENIAGSEDPAQQPSICSFANFAIAALPSGGAFAEIESTEAAFNNHVYWGYAAGVPVNLQMEVNVPLFHVFNYSPQTLPNPGAASLTDIDYIGVVCSTFRTSKTGGGAVNVVDDVFCQRGALTVLKLRG